MIASLDSILDALDYTQDGNEYMLWIILALAVVISAAALSGR